MTIQPERVWRYLATIGGVAIAYWGSAQLTTAVLGLVGTEASPLWPPAGVSLAALLLWGQWVWPGIALGDIISMIQSQGTLWSWITIGSLAGSTLQALVGTTLLKQIGFRNSLSRIRDVLGLVILGGIVTPVVNATLDRTTEVLAGGIPWGRFAQNWLTLWLGDGMGILLVTPLLLLGIPSITQVPRWGKPDYSLKSDRLLEAVACLGLLVATSCGIFGLQTTTQIAEYPLEYLPFPFVVWAALRFGQGGAVLASLLVSGLAIGGAVHSGGPFFLKAGTVEQAILLLQTFMAVVTTTALVLAAAVSERQRAEAKLRALNLDLERQVEERTAQLQEKIQELQGFYELKDTFLQAVAHDLRTSIMGMLMVLKSAHHPDQDQNLLPQRLLVQIIQGCDRQLTLINALLEDHFSEEQPVNLRCSCLSLRDLLQQVVSSLEPLLTKNQATFTNDVPVTLPLAIADPEQLQRVFENLLVNALKHNPPGVSLRVKAAVEGGMLCCRVQDNGVGIDPDQQAALFKLYVRRLFTRHLTGVGLGLYLCREIITAHGGEIGIDSHAGAGTEVWFTLPLAEPQASPLTQQARVI